VQTESGQSAIEPEQAQMQPGGRRNAPDHLQMRSGQPAIEPEQVKMETETASRRSTQSTLSTRGSTGKFDA